MVAFSSSIRILYIPTHSKHKKTLVADLEEVFLSLLFRVEWSYELSYECFYCSNKCMFYSGDTST
jgi:hypothetical protein